MKRRLPILLAALCFGCVTHGTASFDGFGNSFNADASVLAQKTADELGRRHPPAQTSISLDRAPGQFGEYLEQKLREKGYAVTPHGQLGIKYTIGVLDHDNSPSLGYVQVACSDGQNFSVTREVFSGTTPPESSPSVNDASPSLIAESTLPPAAGSASSAASLSPAPAAKPSAPVAASSAPTPQTNPWMGQASQADAAKSSDKPRTYTVQKSISAKTLSSRYNVPLDDLCKWNNVKKDARFGKGKVVFLSDPNAGKAVPAHADALGKPVAPAPASAPAQASSTTTPATAAAPAASSTSTATTPKAQTAPAPAHEPAAAANATAPAPKTYTVKENIRADKLAAKLKLKPKDFYRWNEVGSHAQFIKGNQVIVSEPPAGYNAPVNAPVESHPNATPPTTPANPPSPTPMPAPAQKPALASAPAQPSAVTETALPPSPTPTAAPALPQTAAPAVETLYMPPQPSVWEIQQGMMLRSQMESWAAQAGYSVIWNASNDFELGGSASFNGNFTDAVKNLFGALEQNGLALRVTMYQGNKVMEISDH